jgi:hypothetical protein
VHWSWRRRAYHRQVEQGSVSRRLQQLATRLIGLGMVPLMLGVSLDIYVVSYLVTGHSRPSAVLGTGCLAMFAGLWFAFPWFLKRRRQAR